MEPAFGGDRGGLWRFGGGNGFLVSDICAVVVISGGGGGGSRRWAVSPCGFEIFLIIPNLPRSTRKQSLLY